VIPYFDSPTFLGTKFDENLCFSRIQELSKFLSKNQLLMKDIYTSQQVDQTYINKKKLIG